MSKRENINGISTKELFANTNLDGALFLQRS